MLTFINSKHGLWPKLVVCPEILKQWLDKEPLDGFRQCVAGSIRGLVNEVARLQRMLLDEYLIALEVKFGGIDVDDDKLIKVFNKVMDRVEFKNLDLIIEATTLEDLK